MFSGTHITSAPELPATELKSQCYYWIFSGCDSLTEVTLPATTIGDECYGFMFQDCSSIKDVYVEFTTWNSGTHRWMSGVSPTGTFHCPRVLSIEYGVDRIPTGWTVEYID